MVQRQTDRAFLAWAHRQRGMCAHPACGNAWEELHHYGDDGGMGRRPNDYEVVRLCRSCHVHHGRKRRSLVLSGQIDILEAWQEDTITLLRGWLDAGGRAPGRCGGCDHDSPHGCTARLPHCEPTATCAVEELSAWLVDEAPDLPPDAQRVWLIEWAGRRAANIVAFLAEPMREILRDAVSAGNTALERVARRALRDGGIDDE